MQCVSPRPLSIVFLDPSFLQGLSTQKRKVLRRDSLSQWFVFLPSGVLPVFFCSVWYRATPKPTIPDSFALGLLISFSQWEALAGDCRSGGEKSKYCSSLLWVVSLVEAVFPWSWLLPGSPCCVVLADPSLRDDSRFPHY